MGRPEQGELWGELRADRACALGTWSARPKSSTTSASWHRVEYQVGELGVGLSVRSASLALALTRGGRARCTGAAPMAAEGCALVEHQAGALAQVRAVAVEVGELVDLRRLL